MGVVPVGPLRKIRKVTTGSGMGGRQTTGGFWPSRKGAQISSFAGVRHLVGRPASEGNFKMTKKIEIATIPELNTSVGMHGSVKQKEVAGPLCLAAVVALMYAL
jgi:hypothetical protein